MTMKVIAVLIVLFALAAAGAHEARAASGGKLVTRATATASVGGCKTVTAWRGFKLLIGVMAWKLFERIGWCWNQAETRIVSFGYRRWAEVYVPTWDFKGFVGFTGTGGTGHWSARRWTQGKFQQCAAYCFQTKLPWVDLKVYGDGHWAWASGGS